MNRMKQIFGMAAVLVICVTGVSQGALTTQFQIQITVVPSEQDAKALMEALSGQVPLPLQAVPYQRQYYILAGNFSTQQAAMDAANEPAYREFAQLDVVRVTTDSATVQPGATIFQIQLGFFYNRENSEKYKTDAERRGLKPVFIEAGADGSYRILYGRFTTRDAAAAQLPSVRQAGFEDAWVTTSTATQERALQEIVKIEPLGLFGHPAPAPVAAAPAAPPRQMPQIELPPIHAPEPPPQPQAVQYTRPAAPEDIIITTQPIREARRKTAIPIQARADGADEVNLHYRLKGGISYIRVPMITAGDGTWKAEIPAWAVSSMGVDYYIQARKGIRRFTSDATAESPYHIEVK